LTLTWWGGKTVTTRRYAASLLNSGNEIVCLVGDSVPDVLHKMAMYVEAEGLSL